MDRGFGSAFRGGSGFGGPSRQDRRYDDFYSDGRRGGPPQGRSGPGGVRNSRDWGGSNRDRGFFNQNQSGGRDRGSGNVGGQMLAALQQQQNLLTAFMSSQSRGILPQPGGNSYGGGRHGGGRYGGRPGDKRKQEMAPSGFQNKRNKRPPPSDKKNQNSGSFKSKGSQDKKSKSVSPKREEEPEIPDDEVEVPDSLMDSVEKLRQRKEVNRNVADEDVQKLVVFSFNGKSYQCLTCGSLLMKESAFTHHLEGKSHVMNVIDARTAKKYQEVRDILDIDLAPDDWYEKNTKARSIILKQAKMIMKTQREVKQREAENYNKNPANFFIVTMETRKAAARSGSTVTIKSVVETSMEVKDFAGERFFGCEFIKSVSSFNCRLCGLNIKSPDGVLPHIESRLHKNNYQTHLRRNSGYEKRQLEQNKELSEGLGKHEDNFVLLSQSDKAEDQTFLALMDSKLVRVPELLKLESERGEKKEVRQEDTASSGGKPGEEKNKEEKGGEVEKDDTEAEEKTADDAAENEDVTIKTEEAEEDEGEEGAENDEEYDPYAPTNNTPSKNEEKEEKADEVVKKNPPEVTAMPKKSILKKTPTRPARGGAATKRGRGRGKVTASPKGKKTKDVNDDVSDGLGEGFQVVDEVE